MEYVKRLGHSGSRCMDTREAWNQGLRALHNEILHSRPWFYELKYNRKHYVHYVGLT